MMSKENIRSLGGSWVESLYQKFEAVCQEVDDIVNHDHRRVLENSVQLVGDNVIKFCSNVKDLIPSNAGAPLKDVEQSTEGNEECSSVAIAEQFSQQIDVEQSTVLVESNSKVEDGNEECFSVAMAEQFSQQHIDAEQSAILVESNSEVEEGDEECSSVSITEQFSQKQIDVEKSAILAESNSEVKEGDEEYSSAANTEEYSLQIDFSYSSEGWPSWSKVLDDVHFKDSLENPSSKDPCSSSSVLQLGRSESFSICQETDFVPEEWKQPSEVSDPRFTYSFLTDHKFHSMINEKFDLFTEKEEPLSDTPELTSPDEDPCESSMFHNQNRKLDDKVSTDVSSAASIHSSGPDIHKKEKPLQENVDEQSSELESRFIDGTVNDIIPGEIPGSQVFVKEEMISDINHKLSQESEVQVEEENSPCLVMTSSDTPIENETSTVRLTSTVTYPLLHFSHNTETKTQCTEDTESASVSTFSPASQTSELEDSCSFPFSSQEFTEVPINSPRESEGLKLKHMEGPGKSELDESCVFVQNERNPIHLSNAVRRWTYKKKMRNPFTSRKKLEKEYKQLSLWYCDIDAEFNEVAGDKLVPLSHNDKQKHPSAQDLQDSEWELV